MTKGDILFYRAPVSYPNTPSGWLDKLSDQAIIRRTGSDIIHCAVGWDHGLCIGAESTGVRMVQAGNVDRAYSPQDQMPHFDEVCTWLLGMVGSPYGWGDVLNQGLNLLPGSPTIALNKAYDCSDLCVRFLVMGGYPLPYQLVLDPQDVTPGVLYHALIGA